MKEVRVGAVTRIGRMWAGRKYRSILSRWLEVLWSFKCDPVLG